MNRLPAQYRQQPIVNYDRGIVSRCKHTHYTAVQSTEQLRGSQQSVFLVDNIKWFLSEDIGTIK